MANKQDTSVRFYFHTGCPASLSGSDSALTNIMNACIAGYGQVNIQSLSVSNTLATCVTTTAHNFNPGQVVTIAGSNNAEFNTEWKIYTVTNSTTFTFKTDFSNVTASGTMTVNITALTYLEKPESFLYRFTTGTRRFLYLPDSGYTTYCPVKMRESSTGTNETPTLYVVKSNAASTATRPWVLVANPTMMYFLCAPDATLSTGYTQGFAFGDITTYCPYDFCHSIIMGSTGTTQTDTAFTILNNTSGAYLNRSYIQTGTYIAAYRYGYYGMSYAGQHANFLTTNNGINPVNNKRVYSPITVWETLSLLRGYLPGAYCPVGNIHNGFSIYTDCDKYMVAVKSGLTRGYAIDITGPWDNLYA